MDIVNTEFAGKVLLTALESNSIKLFGPTGSSSEHAAKRGEADAAYILAFMTALTEKKSG